MAQMQGNLTDWYKIDPDDLRQVVYHTFLPKQLPSMEYEDLDQVDKHLVKIVSEHLQNSIPTDCEIDVIQKTRKLFSTWDDIQLNQDSLHITISNMTKGDMIAIYLKAQNAGLLLAADFTDVDSMFTVAGFAASCSSNMVMSSPSSLLMDYPEQCAKIPITKLLKSQYLAKFLRFLDANTAEISMPKTKKAGRSYVENRDVADPILVVDMIIPALCSAKSRVNEDFPRIRKKVRDDVILSNRTLPFRRSGCWMTIKVAFQISLMRELKDTSMATFTYKCKMLSILCSILNAFDKQFLFGDWDLKIQMMAKIARRLEKVRAMFQPISTWYRKLYRLDFDKLHLEITDQLQTIRTRMNEEWSTTSKSNTVETFNVSLQDIENDTKQLLEKLNVARNVRIKIRQIRDLSGTAIPPLPFCPHRLDFSQFPNFSQIITSQGMEQGRITDFELGELEKWIIEHLDDYAHKGNCNAIKDLAFQYSKKAFHHYIADPNAYSKFVLVVLKCVQVLDKIAVNQHPILSEHQHGVDVSFITKILLRGRSELQWAKMLERYFDCRNKGRNLPSLIAEQHPSHHSFGVRFAKQSSEMQTLIHQIDIDMENMIDQKLSEIKVAKRECEELRSQMEEVFCNGTWKWVSRRRKCQLVHSQSCTYCDLDHRLKQRLHSVTPYERPLPSDLDMRCAVVFELRLPDEIACLRDILQFFQHDLLAMPSLKCHTADIIRYWVTYDGVQGYCRQSTGTAVKLVSTRKPSIVTHNVRSMSVDQNEEDFILPNGLNVLYRGVTTLDTGGIGSRCIFKINGSSYNGMQWAIDSCKHTPNQVMARLSECPKGLSSAEFIQFGLLRAGNLLQYRNIVVSLVNGKLSLKSEAVLALLCQVIWETGSSERNNHWNRDAHVDLLEPKFASELLKLVDELVNCNEKNWNDPYTICCLVVIVTRILESTESDDVRKMSVDILKKSRSFAIKWIESIEILITKAMNASESEKNMLKLKIVLAALAVTLSFGVSQCFVSCVMQDKEDLLMWLIAISTLQNELLWNLDKRIKDLRVSDIQRSFLRITINIAIMLEPTISKIICQNSNVLSNFSKLRWLLANPKDAVWEKCAPPHQEVFRCMSVMSKRSTSKNHVVYIDVLLGKFLVDGCPIGKLPEQITSHFEYQRVFQSAEMKVQPNKEGSSIIYTTTMLYNGCSYSFQLHGEILLVQATKDSNCFELLPHYALDSKLPSAFEDNHSHWWESNSQTEVLHFANKDFRDIDFSETIFKLDLRTNILKKRSSRTLLAMHSRTVTNLTKVFLRIEQLYHIHVWVFGEKNNEFFVELTVLGLKFHFSYGSLVSNEFPGMKVDKLQDFGSLVGLHTKLILVDTCNKSKKNRKVIVPHGDIQIAEVTRNHQKVSINLNTLQNPKFFVYEIDERLQILIAGRNQSAWFYLAALHGATASPLPDLITRLTGTEMAFQILQSARIWSCNSYDEASLKILENIQQFVPERHYYPSHLKVLQKINWPIGLPPTAAHEGYLFIVEKLLQDSQRLEISHKLTKQNLIWSMELNERHYWRHITYMNDLVKISADFNNKIVPALTHYYRQPLQSSTNDNVRLIAYLCHDWICQHHRCMKHFVTKSLMRCAPLTGTTGFVTITGRLETENWFVQESKLKDIHNNWLDLYLYALQVGKCDNLRPEWQMILSSMLIQGVDICHIQILHLIAINSDHFRSLLPPSISKYEEPASTFKESLVRNEIVTESLDGDFDSPEAEDLARKNFNKLRQSEIEEICSFVTRSWMATPRSVTIPRKYRIVNVPTTETKINKVIRMWYDNLQLSNFLKSFETKLTWILDNNISESKLYMHPLILRKSCESINVENPKTDLFSTIVDANLNLDVDSKNIYENLSDKYESKHFSEKRCFETYLSSLMNKSTQMWDDLVNLLTGENKKALDASGLHPRLVPLTLLPLLLQHSPQIEHFQNRIGAIGVLWTLEQKMERCIQYLNSGPSMLVAFQREEETKGRKCWVPKKYPGWLLLELELNMMIRTIQYKVAKEMMKPSFNDNSVMQLNMGEGKTALIVPMLVVALANGTQLCRVTIIKSIFETNFNALRYTIGGLLNRRVYTIPCRRDFQLTTDICNNFLTIYKECRINRGIVVTLPEHRLSFQLKGYEIAGKGNAALAKPVIEIQKWLNENTRDILDESDELLHVKYQLIYSIGNQEHLDGGELRWKICQGILKCIPKHFANLQVKHGDSVIEYKSNFDNPAIFPHCRILKTNVYAELIDLLAEDFLNGLIIGFASLKSDERRLVKIFLTDNNLTDEHVHNVEELFFNNHRNWTILLTMAGYLRFRVLEAALVKRWRVNFGVDVRNMFRLMAVPFKAKDVASERTEFGHSDIAITFTQLSYYYSGLTDEQILQCFNLLKKSDILNPMNEYDSWIQFIPKIQIDPSVQRYDGINLGDYEQKSKHLFPMLRKTMQIINFWRKVYNFWRKLKESKQFPGKMTCTAWDLCSENKSLLTTGFSGTNDTQNLLPLTIKQRDLEELQATNLNLEKILLDPVNNSYEALNNDISSGSILEKLKQRQIKILLDCGALMLELNNEEVAEEWLKIDSSLQAVVFFNKKNILTVKDRAGKDCDFELSPFREMLNKCGVYLDDEHTRGTDLKFPLDSQACVTLGSGLTRDKMVQACMRMRMLEKKGHTVTFWASHEVDAKIKEMSGCSNQCGSKEVLEWVKHNSQIFVEDGLIYWTVAAVNYCRKRAAERNFDSGNQTNCTQLGLQCTEEEVMKLTSMYGHSRQKQTFSQIVPNWFIATKKSLGLPDDHVDFKNIPPQVLAHINSLIPTKSFYSQLLDEEQEKELEFELEQELECDPAPAVEPRQHRLTIFEALFQGRIKPEVDKEIIGVCNIFRDTSVWGSIQQNCWGKDVFVSQDFIDTVVTDRYRLELKTMFIRPVTWVIKMGLENQILIISPFEANRLITEFRAGKFNCSLHLYVPRNLPKQDNLITKISLRLPVLMDFQNDMHFNWDKILPPLSLCAGCLYFSSNAERKEFERFLALLPKPRNERYEEAFNHGFICKTNGFVAPEHRIKFPNEIHINAFIQNPEKLVTDIMRIRHEGLFPEDSHVAKLILEGMSVFIQPFDMHSDGDHTSK